MSGNPSRTLENVVRDFIEEVTPFLEEDIIKEEDALVKEESSDAAELSFNDYIEVILKTEDPIASRTRSKIAPIGEIPFYFKQSPPIHLIETNEIKNEKIENESKINIVKEEPISNRTRSKTLVEPESETITYVADWLDSNFEITSTSISETDEIDTKNESKIYIIKDDPVSNRTRSNFK